MILCLETATTLCSVALCDSAGVISLRESNSSKSHASMLTVYIGEILKETGIKTIDLNAVAVSKGPGSYTGLRIGVSVAKGIAYASSIPLIGIDTTFSMFWGIAGRKKEITGIEERSLYCPMLDARRMEVYYAIYDNEGNTVKEITADIISEASFDNIDETRMITFFGDGAAKCKEVIKRPNIYFDEDFRISASHMYMPAFKLFKNNIFENVAYFEPFYLKDFITSKPRKNILGK
jgi:tRNA threonylcarbamoyladenosine biosynthesis protein TsaB